MAKIKLWLYNNPLTEDPNDYLAKVSSAGRFELDDVVDDIVADRSEYQAETIRSISTLLFKQIGKRLKEGYTVQTPLFSASLGVTGAFRSKTAQFTKNDHQLKIKLRTNGAFLDDLQEAEVEVLGVADVAGGIGKVTDSQTGAVNSTITPNDIFKIDGVKIKVEGNDSVVGVYLIRRADGTRVKLDRIVTNYPLKLMVLLPSLETGDYQLEIITQYCGNGKLLHQPRIIAFQHLLTVL